MPEDEADSVSEPESDTYGDFDPELEGADFGEYSDEEAEAAADAAALRATEAANNMNNIDMMEDAEPEAEE